MGHFWDIGLDIGLLGVLQQSEMQRATPLYTLQNVTASTSAIDIWMFGVPHVEWALDLFPADGREHAGASGVLLYFRSSARRIRLCWEATGAPWRIAIRLTGRALPRPVALRSHPSSWRRPMRQIPGFGAEPQLAAGAAVLVLLHPLQLRFASYSSGLT